MKISMWRYRRPWIWVELAYWLIRARFQPRVKPTFTAYGDGPWFNGSYPYQALQPDEKNRIINGDMKIDQAQPDRRYGEWTWHKDAEL